jgi:hypothetical protein
MFEQSCICIDDSVQFDVQARGREPRREFRVRLFLETGQCRERMRPARAAALVVPPPWRVEPDEGKLEDVQP